MKKLFLAAVAFGVLVAVPATAADLAQPVYTAADTWTGFYIGLNAGAVWDRDNTITTRTDPVSPDDDPILLVLSEFLAELATGTVNAGDNTSFIGGGQVGYNRQFGSFVAGVEADIQGISDSGKAGSFTSTGVLFNFFPATSTTTSRMSSDYLGTVRGRLGWLVSPSLLLYGTGGLAYGDIETTTTLSQTGVIFDVFPFVGLASGSDSDTLFGWTVGGGFEWKAGSRASVKLEYLHYDLGSVSYSSTLVSPLFADAGTPVYGVSRHVTSDLEGDIVRVGLNWHLNWGAPELRY